MNISPSELLGISLNPKYHVKQVPPPPCFIFRKWMHASLASNWYVCREIKINICLLPGLQKWVIVAEWFLRFFSPLWKKRCNVWQPMVTKSSWCGNSRESPKSLMVSNQRPEVCLAWGCPWPLCWPWLSRWPWLSGVIHQNTTNSLIHQNSCSRRVESSFSHPCSGFIPTRASPSMTLMMQPGEGGSRFGGSLHSQV